MTQYSKARQMAENAFRKIQSASPVQNSAAAEVAAIARARAEKTSRLKNARLAKEADERARASVAPISR
jgi:hypothetical protein